MEDMGVIVEEVEVIEIASFANRNNYYQFIYDFLCLLALLRSNTFIKFRLANVFKLPLINLLLPLKLSI